jgi:hypothetical protein
MKGPVVSSQCMPVWTIVRSFLMRQNAEEVQSKPPSVRAVHMPPTRTTLSVRAASEEQKAAGYDRACQVRWCWADALFMAPPGWTALSSVTKDPKYLEYSDREYWATHASLYRKLEDGSGLFLRDSRFYSKADAKGNLVYWSRGNGWVFAGLPAIIDYLPSSHPSRPRYSLLYSRDALHCPFRISSCGTASSATRQMQWATWSIGREGTAGC